MHRKFELPELDIDNIGNRYNRFSDLINGRIWTLLVMLFIVLVVTSRDIGIVKFSVYCIYLLIFTLCISSNLKIILNAIFFILPAIVFLTVMYMPYLVKLNCSENRILFGTCIDMVVGSRLLQTVGKVFLCIFSLVVYTSSLTKTRIIESLQWLGVPKIITKIISITLMYFEVLKGELERMKVAMKLRLFSKQGFWIYWKLITFCIGTLFLHSYRKITYLYYSLRLRGYDGTMRDYNIMPISINDFAFFVVMVSILLLIKVSSVVYY